MRNEQRNLRVEQTSSSGNNTIDPRNDRVITNNTSDRYQLRRLELTSRALKIVKIASWGELQVSKVKQAFWEQFDDKKGLKLLLQISKQCKNDKLRWTTSFSSLKSAFNFETIQQLFNNLKETNPNTTDRQTEFNFNRKHLSFPSLISFDSPPPPTFAAFQSDTQSEQKFLLVPLRSVSSGSRCVYKVNNIFFSRRCRSIPLKVNPISLIYRHLRGWVKNVVLVAFLVLLLFS